MSELASKAIDALAAVRAIDTTSIVHPMRHNVRELKQQAEQTLAEAFFAAHRLAFLAESIVREYDKAAEKESK